MNIKEYCDKHCNGSKAAFARTFGRLPQNVSIMFSMYKRWHVIEVDGIEFLVQIKNRRILEKGAD